MDRANSFVPDQTFERCILVLAFAILALADGARTQAHAGPADEGATVNVPRSASAEAVADRTLDLLSNKAVLKRLTQGPMQRFRFADMARRLPDVRAVDAKGRDRSLSEWRGSLVLLNIWASWCAPCREEMPALARLQVRVRGLGLRVVTLSIDKTAEDAQGFVVKTGVQALPLLSHPDPLAMKSLGVDGVPMSLLIDQNGREVGRISGAVDWDSDEALLLLKAVALKTGGYGGQPKQ